MGSMVCLVFAGIMLGNLTGEELSSMMWMKKLKTIIILID